MTHGMRVGWADDGRSDPALHGTVVEPTPEELAYAAERYGPDTAVRCVLVEWDEDGARAWHEPADLRELAP